MPFTMPFMPANRTGAGGVCGIHIHHPQTASPGLVLHKLLELRPGPTVQAGTHSPARPDALAEVRQFFKGDHGTTGAKRFRDNRLADFVVHVADVASFPAGDFPQKLFGALGAVALKTPATPAEPCRIPGIGYHDIWKPTTKKPTWRGVCGGSPGKRQIPPKIRARSIP